MPSPLSSIVISRLEKAAVDNGFDRELPPVGEWRAFASTQCPLSIWLGVTSGGDFAIALSQHQVAVALETLGEAFGEALPTGAFGARVVPDIPTLHHLIRRAYQISKTLPDELLHVFVARTATLPRTTEAERLVIQRVGQDIFRQGLLDYWEGRCAITGLAVPELLRASRIKPWAACEADAERLDIYNGLLLAPHPDAAFFHLYGLNREDTAYVMDTFPIVRKHDEKAHGDYRTRRVILEIYDALAESVRTATPYPTRLNPPPADPSCCHPDTLAGAALQSTPIIASK